MCVMVKAAFHIIGSEPSNIELAKNIAKRIDNVNQAAGARIIHDMGSANVRRRHNIATSFYWQSRYPKWSNPCIQWLLICDALFDKSNVTNYPS